MSTELVSKRMQSTLTVLLLCSGHSNQPTHLLRRGRQAGTFLNGIVGGTSDSIRRFQSDRREKPIASVSATHSKMVISFFPEVVILLARFSNYFFAQNSREAVRLTDAVEISNQ